MNPRSASHPEPQQRQRLSLVAGIRLAAPQNLGRVLRLEHSGRGTDDAILATNASLRRRPLRLDLDRRADGDAGRDKLIEPALKRERENFGAGQLVSHAGKLLMGGW